MLGFFSATAALLVPSPVPNLSPRMVPFEQVVQQPIIKRGSPASDLVFPSTMMLALGRGNVPGGEVYTGSADDLDLSSFLDSVPVDSKGEAGLAKDAAGVERIKEASERPMTPAEKQKAKQEAFAAKQAEDAANGISLPGGLSLPKLF